MTAAIIDVLGRIFCGLIVVAMLRAGCWTVERARLRAREAAERRLPASPLDAILLEAMREVDAMYPESEPIAPPRLKDFAEHFPETGRFTAVQRRAVEAAEKRKRLAGGESVVTVASTASEAPATRRRLFAPPTPTSPPWRSVLE